ncbi:hypothetical protein Rt10032_c07g3069 [Rhodotorula toruloides]|uniref:Ribosomal RNA-processing protein 7 C-terminal domain-containing protein n=1 Tax=Rhodotorula toruloides TaxID=5286 RepID=A0A511KFC1_RHOTO|nr:hypothetical protein Rt10032_c07g3069 [Rhodotorula toruloides]
MARLSTQHESIKAVPLRSGFYALALNNGKTHLFARLHHAAALEGHADGAESSKQLFVTGLPLGVSEKGLKAALGKVWGDSCKVKEVRSLQGASTKDYMTLYEKEVASAPAAEGAGAPEVAPLFDPSEPSTSTPIPPPHSAIVTFSSTPSLPPPAYPATTPLTLPAAPSFLSASAARHARARPHRSVVIAHVDEWMRAYDARKTAAAPASYDPEAARAAAEEAKGQKAKKGKKGKAVDVGPLPGSAAEALARYQAEMARKNEAAFNPDEEDDGEWHTVSRGGKHGKSLLPTNVVPTLTGYGGVNVKVAGKKRGKVAAEEPARMDAGVKKIVGDGFYSFNRAEGRKRDLANLKSRFEEDKRRLDRLRAGGAGKQRGGSAGWKGRFKPY